MRCSRGMDAGHRVPSSDLNGRDALQRFCQIERMAPSGNLSLCSATVLLPTQSSPNCPLHRRVALSIRAMKLKWFGCR